MSYPQGDMCSVQEYGMSCSRMHVCMSHSTSHSTSHRYTSTRITPYTGGQVTGRYQDLIPERVIVSTCLADSDMDTYTMSSSTSG